MALIIEDGTMPNGANTFASVADADAYFSERGNTDWPAKNEEVDANLSKKENALIRAADYLNTLSWKGARVSWDWPMCWPRQQVPIPGDVKDREIPDNVVPSCVKRACMELAVLFYNGEDPLASQERGGRVKSETVGPLSTSYFDDASNETYYPAVAGLISDYLTVVPGEASSMKISVHKVRPI